MSFEPALMRPPVSSLSAMDVESSTVDREGPFEISLVNPFIHGARRVLEPQHPFASQASGRMRPIDPALFHAWIRIHLSRGFHLLWLPDSEIECSARGPSIPKVAV